MTEAEIVQPTLRQITDKHPVIGEQDGFIEVNIEREITFNMQDDDKIDLDSWVFQFDGWFLTDFLQKEFDCRLHTIDKIVGHADVFRFQLDCMEVVVYLDQLLSSLVFGGTVPTQEGGWRECSPNELWGYMKGE